MTWTGLSLFRRRRSRRCCGRLVRCRGARTSSVVPPRRWMTPDPAARGGGLHQCGAAGAPPHAAGTSVAARREVSRSAPVGASTRSVLRVGAGVGVGGLFRHLSIGSVGAHRPSASHAAGGDPGRAAGGRCARLVHAVGAARPAAGRDGMDRQPPVVERTFGWLSRHRRLVRDYERLPEHHEAMVLWATTMIMTRQLVRQLAGNHPAHGGAPNEPRHSRSRKIQKRHETVHQQAL